jgi:hypothetical protein
VREVIFGSGVASSVSERDVSTPIERQHLMPVLGGGTPPENFDFGGISGGVMLTVIQTTIRSWSLAGVIYQGPNGRIPAYIDVLCQESAPLVGLEVPAAHAQVSANCLQYRALRCCRRRLRRLGHGAARARIAEAQHKRWAAWRKERRHLGGS